MNYRILVIGGGASGMVAAIEAARSGAKVTVLEHQNRVGKKILVTGNGKCNITNLDMDQRFFRSDNKSFPGIVLNYFNEKDTMDYFQDLGIEPLNRNGYIYPNSGQASSVLEVLMLEMERLGIDVITDFHVTKIERKKAQWLVTGEKDAKLEKVVADAAIIATGSKAGSKTGSDGSGYELAKSLGHRIITPVPALVQLRTEGNFLKQWTGIRCDGAIQLKVNGKVVSSDRGELQLTDYGISGIPIFQVSRFASKALAKKKKVAVTIDFLPDILMEEVESFFNKRFKSLADRNMENALIGLFNKKLALVLLKQAGISATSFWKNLDHKKRIQFIKNVKGMELAVIGTNSFEQAQVCAGGIDTTEVYPETMESKIAKGIYFTGEILDVDGMCGGYNLQWAWTTGAIAGRKAAEKVGNHGKRK